MNLETISDIIKRRVVIRKYGKTLQSECEYGFANVKGIIGARHLATRIFGLKNQREVNFAIALLTSKEFAKPLEDDVIILGDNTRPFDTKRSITDHKNVKYVIYGNKLSEVKSPNNKLVISHYHGNNNDSLFVTVIGKKHYVHFARYLEDKSTKELWEYIKSQLSPETVKEIEHVECRPHLEMYPDYNGEYHEIRR